ncbi:MAG: hypothetical protein HY912_11535 [Desulfomonile tiedjei]|uniref:Uncharacterized protein n=1 Tax=Desulfomonile tiedjei TaxID=2358 RepID=A0A9D6V123_9BACT|nr:hypothetical protein [Desulfomonile tiedjei]
MKLAVTIDVEEEGLFSNRYDPLNVPVENVLALTRLDPVFRNWGIRPTLLCTYAVVVQKRHQDLLLSLQAKWGAEIGAHLHHWNTPPLEELPYRQPVPSDLMDVRLLTAKLEMLLRAMHEMGIVPSSFRMGRFNMGPKMFSVIEKAGILVDSSVAPMRRYYGGPDHLAAPTDPYFPDPLGPVCPGNSKILEVPVTILPVVAKLGNVFQSMRTNKALEDRISWIAANLGSLPAQPMWTGLKRLKAAVAVHRRRGGRVLTIFFHSSELMPGGCPEHKTEKDIDSFFRKLDGFFSWLHNSLGVQSVTLSELGDLYRAERLSGGI